MAYLGIDVGTSNLKVLVLDETGIQAVASASYTPQYPHATWAEMSPQVWWQALQTALQQLPVVLKERVQGIGFSGQMHGVVLTRDDGSATHPAILWLDGRTSTLLQQFPANTEQDTLNPRSVGMYAASLAWLVEHQPEAVQQASWALLPKDWLRFQLCAVPCTDPTDSTGTLLADAQGQWLHGIAETLHIPARLLPEVVASHRVVGDLSSRAGEILGLPKSAKVFVGAADTACALLGSGIHQAGQSLLTTGTGAQFVHLVEQKPSFHPAINAYRAITPHWYVMAAMQNAGVALNWAKNMLGFESWQQAYSEAFAQPSAVFFLPYLSGERSPIMNPHAKGCWLGLQGHTTRGQMMYAAFEGVALSIRDGFELLKSQYPIENVYLAGGGSVFPEWQQLLSNVLGVSLIPIEAPHSSTLGAALLGSGLTLSYGTVKTLVAIHPQAYPTERFVQFKAAYSALEPWFTLVS